MSLKLNGYMRLDACTMLYFSVFIVKIED